jgi:DNA-binding response OmpR family regulator
MSQIEENVVVLVADDEPSTLALVASHVRSRGYKVLEASDGDQAWQLAHEHLPDLVILDVMMPGMSGWEVCRKIREAVSLAHTGVIMLTGIGENLNEMTSPLYGADAYLDKPFEFADLDAKVSATLAERREGAMGRPDPEAVPRRQTEPPPEGANGMSAPVLARPPQEATKRRAAREAEAEAGGRPTKRVAPARPTKRIDPKADGSPERKAKPKAKSATTRVAAKAAAKSAAKPAKGKSAKAAPAKKSAKAKPKAKPAAKAAKSAPKGKAMAKKAGKAKPKAAKPKAKAPVKATKAKAKAAKPKARPATKAKAAVKPAAKAKAVAKPAAKAKAAPKKAAPAPKKTAGAKKSNGAPQKRPQPGGAEAV